MNTPGLLPGEHTAYLPPVVGQTPRGNFREGYAQLRALKKLQVCRVIAVNLLDSDNSGPDT